MTTHHADGLGRLSLAGKVAVITGAAGGLGAETARLMAVRGAAVVLAGQTYSRVEALANELRADGHRAHAVDFDLGDEESIRNMIGRAVWTFGQLDILFNNAAEVSPETNQRDMDIQSMDTDVWDRVFRVNVRGTMIACREALPLLLATGDGVIISTSSALAEQGHIVQNAYSTSKAALVQMMRNIAASHGPRGIRANVVAPGLTLTPQVAKIFPAAVKTLVEKETLRNRLGEPADIAELVAFLASDAAANINGQLIVSDGGCGSHVPDIAGYRALGAASAPA